MHSAPPVTYPLGRSHLQAWVLLGLWLAGAVLLLAWGLFAPGLDWRLGVTLLALLMAGLVAWRGWTKTPAGQLRWDGQVWSWESARAVSPSLVRELSVALDFQHIMLLRLQTSDQALLWLWAQRRSMPERWLDLRRAAHGRRQSALADSAYGSMPPSSPRPGS